jgi:mannose/fructose-specific phosphotransferase system component IIA
MMSEAYGIVVAHADLAAALVRTVERISGVEGALVAISNDGCGLDELKGRLAGECGRGRTVFFVDLAGGSCGLAGLGIARGGGEIAVISGANVPMLLDFVFHRDLELGALAERLADRARDGIRVTFVPAADAR